MRSPARTGYVHDALYVTSERDLLLQCGELARTGLAEGDKVVLICRDRITDLLVADLGDDERIGVLPAEQVHRHATRALAAYCRLVQDELAAGSSRVRLVTEVDLGDDFDAWLEWMRFEALCNRVLDGLPLWSVCVYDRSRVPPEALVSAGVTHPNLVDGGVRRSNPLYQEPAEVLLTRADDGPDPLEAGVPEVEIPDVRDVRELRRVLREALRAACRPRMAGDAADDFQLAVGEVVTNAMSHGNPPVRFRLWTAPGKVVCTVTDTGPGTGDPFAGYMPLHGERPLQAGMGLWLARQLCHRLQMSRGPEGFTVRLTGC